MDIDIHINDIIDMDKQIGNYTGQADRSFPLDCEGLDSLQNLSLMASFVGNIAGSDVDVILYGCEKTGSQWSEGYLFVHTDSMPEGEVLYVKSGASDRVSLVVSDTAVSSQGTDYPKAYTTRRLEHGEGSETFDLTQMVRLNAAQRIAELEAEVEKLKNQGGQQQGDTEPVGVIKMYAGLTAPEGYMLCTGASLLIDDYPELYKVIGTTFNGAAFEDGKPRPVTDGVHFRIPDLRGRFIVGYSPNDGAYNELGKTGGAKTVTLTVDQMPKHDHYIMADYLNTKNKNNDKCYSWEKPPIVQDDEDHPKKTAPAGGSKAHENRPPFYALAYIIKVK